MAEVYGAVTDRILVNLARHFPFVHSAGQMRGSFDYQVRMLAQLGQVSHETAQIILDSLSGADEALRASLDAAIRDALKTEEPKLRKAAEKGLLPGAPTRVPEVEPGQMQAFRAYYRQSADKLNLVNTVMLESTERAYRRTVADVAARIERSQGILNEATGEVVTGVSTWNTAVRDAVQKMVANGLTGFIDRGGHHWTPEAYVAMDVRTTMFNTARAAIWERSEQFGSDLYQVSSHIAARPLCYTWQGKVISRNDIAQTVEDIDGNQVEVIPQRATSYGQAAGLFGVNCKHYPMTFIPGFSALRGEPQDPEENAKAYAQSQEQRRLERRLREEKRDLAVMRAQGADPDQIRAQRERIRKASDDIDAFCDQTGLPRRKNREYTPINATWPERERTNELFNAPQKAPVSTEAENQDISKPDAGGEVVTMGDTAERRTYGKTTGMKYSATLDDEITLLESGRKKGADGEWVDFSAETKTVTVPQNDAAGPMIYQLPSGAQTFLANDETRNTIMTDGRIAVNRDTGNNNTRARVTEMLENEIDILGGVRKDGVWYRVTSNAKDAEYIKAGTIRKSKNHATGETEDGLSVWERPKYHDKYLERLSGEVIGIGTDGEPLLDVETVKLLDGIDVQAAQERGRARFLETYRWTEQQLDEALRGAYKITR